MHKTPPPSRRPAGNGRINMHEKCINIFFVSLSHSTAPGVYIGERNATPNPTPGEGERAEHHAPGGGSKSKRHPRKPGADPTGNAATHQRRQSRPQHRERLDHPGAIPGHARPCRSISKCSMVNPCPARTG